MIIRLRKWLSFGWLEPAWKSIKPVFGRRCIYLIYVQIFLLNYNCWYFENINQHSVKRQITWAMPKHRKIKFKTKNIRFLWIHCICPSDLRQYEISKLTRFIKIENIFFPRLKEIWYMNVILKHVYCSLNIFF